ncbi:family 43 glycosylhydrolase [Streptomyces luteogriseus]|uniref:family 43 glycosylhydrolase n=1 Tax=Streptomyces luteogriseus TaxID=68233 RepID=UPI0027D7D08E|nr:family 43 glycosylhydrolase [Streptomyces luteogriseus]
MVAGRGRAVKDHGGVSRSSTASGRTGTRTRRGIPIGRCSRTYSILRSCGDHPAHTGAGVTRGPPMHNRPAGLIRNPVLPGSHPDPSILRVGPDFYLATSTFEWYPGVRLHHSTDLVHWRPLGGALTGTRLPGLRRRLGARPQPRGRPVPPRLQQRLHVPAGSPTAPTT